MKCYSEGDLRSYLDGELPPETIRAIAAHLADCRPCAASVATLSARASRVSALLEGLTELPLPLGRPRRNRWLPATAALAAALALAFILLPRRHRPAPPPAPIATIAPRVQPFQVAQAVRPAVSPKPKRPRKPQTETFLALDSDPFEVGVVRRVALGPDEIPADMVFDPDGRPRAIRLVNDSANQGDRP